MAYQIKTIGKPRKGLPGTQSSTVGHTESPKEEKRRSLEVGIKKRTKLRSVLTHWGKDAKRKGKDRGILSKKHRK